MNLRSSLWLVSLGFVTAIGCSAGNTDTTTTGTSSGGSGQGGGTTSSAQGGSSSSTGGSTGSFTTGNGGSNTGGGGGVPVNDCGTGCGGVELCDGIHKGLDDNCDGTIDEGCPCSQGQAASCFKGDPSYATSPGCLPGTMYCTELGTWGPCTGGFHAVPPDNCQNANPMGCHPISGVPFQTVDLYDGTGTFSNGGTNEMWTVTCPPGVSPCPAPNGNLLQPLQSGEYTVTYTSSNGTCTFPLYVGARGLRVELSWNHPTATDHVDLDLHLHQPATTSSFSISGATQDCGYGNCTAYDFDPTFPSPSAPQWFPANNTPPDPVNWYDDNVTPNDQGNLCYFGPGAAGWVSMDNGCHSPRLDLDNITCDATVTDPTATDFCTPENINVDFPPKDQWFRVGVHFYGQTSLNENIYPTVKIFCDGKLAGEVGAVGFHNPESPMVWTAADEDKFWLVGDVMFRDDGCVKECVVKPIYGDVAQKTPYVENTSGSLFSQTAAFGPAYPPNP